MVCTGRRSLAAHRQAAVELRNPGCWFRCWTRLFRTFPLFPVRCLVCSGYSQTETSVLCPLLNTEHLYQYIYEDRLSVTQPSFWTGTNELVNSIIVHSFVYLLICFIVINTYGAEVNPFCFTFAFCFTGLMSMSRSVLYSRYWVK